MGETGMGDDGGVFGDGLRRALARARRRSKRWKRRAKAAEKEVAWLAKRYTGPGAGGGVLPRMESLQKGSRLIQWDGYMAAAGIFERSQVSEAAPMAAGVIRVEEQRAAPMEDDRDFEADFVRKMLEVADWLKEQ